MLYINKYKYIYFYAPSMFLFFLFCQCDVIFKDFIVIDYIDVRCSVILLSLYKNYL